MPRTLLAFLVIASGCWVAVQRLEDGKWAEALKGFEKVVALESEKGSWYGVVLLLGQVSHSSLLCVSCSLVLQGV